MYFIWFYFLKLSHSFLSLRFHCFWIFCILIFNAHIFIFLFKFLQSFIFSFICIFIRIFIFSYLYLYLFLFLFFIYIFIYIYIYIYTYIYIFIYIYIYIYFLWVSQHYWTLIFRTIIENKCIFNAVTIQKAIFKYFYFFPTFFIS